MDQNRSIGRSLPSGVASVKNPDGELGLTVDNADVYIPFGALCTGLPPMLGASR